MAILAVCRKWHLEIGEIDNEVTFCDRFMIGMLKDLNPGYDNRGNGENGITYNTIGELLSLNKYIISGGRLSSKEIIR